VPERPADGWLVEAHWVYVGRYGHLLLGNFTVSFQHMEDTPDGGALLFQVTYVVYCGRHLWEAGELGSLDPGHF